MPWINDNEIDFWRKTLVAAVFQSDIPSVHFTGEFKEMRGCCKVTYSMYLPTYTWKMLDDYPITRHTIIPIILISGKDSNFLNFFKHREKQNISKFNTYRTVFERSNIFRSTMHLKRALILSFPKEIIIVSLFSCKWETNVDFLSLQQMNIGFLSLNKKIGGFLSLNKMTIGILSLQ
jgi:hypothetical protein